MIRVAVVGYGYWGPNLARNIAEAPGCELAAICDLSVRRLVLARRSYPETHLATDWLSMLADPRIDAVAIATPAATHFDLALDALRAGKHVLVEKPLACTSGQAQALVEESERRGLVLMVDHSFVFSPAVREIHKLLAAGTLGELCYYDSVRINLGLIRRDVNVLWDLAVHDLSILDYLLPAAPVGVLATGVAPVAGEHEHVAHMTLLFPGPFIAHVHASWLAPVKTRRLLIGGSQGSVAYDDLNQAEKVKIFRHPLEPGPDKGTVMQRRLGEVWSPRLEPMEPLRGVVEHFVHCIATGARPVTDGASGLRVVRLLEAATRALGKGERIDLVGTEGAGA